MLTMTGDWLGGFASVLAFSMDPWVLLPTLALITFLLEDAAIAAGVALALNGTIGWPAAFAAVAGGIAIGDLSLYGLGRLAVRIPALRRRLNDAPFQRAGTALEARLTAAVLVARVMPGLRFVTYTAAGLLGVPFPRFAALVCAAVTVWTAGLFWLATALGRTLGDALERVLGLDPALAVILAVLSLAALATILPRLLRGISANKSVDTGASS
jgi:membrane protein DedA with SNARE-associated domain